MVTFVLNITFNYSAHVSVSLTHSPAISLYLELEELSTQPVRKKVCRMSRSEAKFIAELVKAHGTDFKVCTKCMRLYSPLQACPLITTPDYLCQKVVLIFILVLTFPIIGFPNTKPTIDVLFMHHSNYASINFVSINLWIIISIVVSPHSLSHGSYSYC